MSNFRGYFGRYSIFAAALCLLPAGAAAATSSSETLWLTYKNHEFGYTISYPKGWTVNPFYIYSGIGPDLEIHGVAFAIPKSLTQGTNLSSDLTAVSVENLPRGRSCDAGRFLPDAQDVHTLKQDGRIWSVASGGDAGAGNYYETSVFALAAKTRCLAVRTVIHSTNIANYDPGTVKPFDRRKLLTVFDRIRRSLKLATDK